MNLDLTPMDRQGSRFGTTDLYGLSVRAVESSNAAERVSPCPACSAETAVRSFEVEDFAEPVVTCTECRLGRFDPMPSAEHLRALYPDEYYGEPGLKFRNLVEPTKS